MIFSRLSNLLATLLTVGCGRDPTDHGWQYIRIWLSFYKWWHTRHYDCNCLLCIMEDTTVGFGWHSTNNGRQNSWILLAFYVSWHTAKNDCDGILHFLTDKTVGFWWYSSYVGRYDRRMEFYILCHTTQKDLDLNSNIKAVKTVGFHDKNWSYYLNPTARSESYWALGAQVPTQLPCLVSGRKGKYDQNIEGPSSRSHRVSGPHQQAKHSSIKARQNTQR